MDNYYDQLIADIKQAIQMGDFAEASRRINEELSMPYVPLGVEKQLEELRLDLVAPKIKERGTVSDRQALERLLAGNEEMQAQAIDHLSRLNIRLYLDLITQYLCSDKDPLFKGILIIACIKQQVTEELDMETSDQKIRFIPAFLEDPFSSEGYEAAENWLEEWIGHSDPSLMIMARDLLMQAVIVKLPESYEEYEARYLALAVYKRIMLAMHDPAKWQKFCSKHQINEDTIMDINL